MRVKSSVAVSVILPVRNGAGHLQEALDSLYRQTLRDFELIVVDDASDDATAEILARQRDPRLRVFRNATNLRICGSLNRAMEEARGRWVARMDADDIAHPRRFERQVAALASHPETGIVGTAVTRFGGPVSGRLAYPVSPPMVRAFALFNCPFAHPTVMWSAARFKQGGYRYDDRYERSEDYDLWVRALERMEGRNLPQALLRYRVHAASVTGTAWDEMDRQAARVQSRLLQWLGLPSDGQAALWHRAVSTARVAASVHELERMGQWLHTVMEANDSRRWCEPSALAATADDVWFRCCMAATRLGADVLRVYRARVLRRGPHRARRALMLHASVLRRGNSSS